MSFYSRSAGPARRSALLLLALAGTLAAAGPLSNEDVVRMFVTGTTTDRLIEKIRSSEVDFDLSEDMLEELSIAGLPDELVQAMVERQNELHPPAEAAPPESARETDAPPLRIRLNPRPGADADRPRPTLRLLDAVDPDTVDKFRLRAHERQFGDLAIVLICRTADHVPDHWRNRSPLGRDFVATPRHQLLAFEAGAERKAAGKLKQKLSQIAVLPGERDSLTELGVLELAVPESIEVRLETGVAHDLTLGIAVQVGERYLLIAEDSWDGVIIGEEGLELTAELRTRKTDPAGQDVRFRRKASAGD